MVNGIEHVAIYAKDTKALTDWYVDMFDFDIVYDNGKGTYFVAAADKSMIEICPATTEPSLSQRTEHGIRHIAFSTDALEELTDKMLKAGVDVVMPMTINEKGVGTFFFRDIEGNILHFIQRPSPLI